MLPSNNFSPIPWYENLSEQDARKWWVYNKVYPLFAQGAFILPFQIILPHENSRLVESVRFLIFRDNGDYIGVASINKNTGLRLYKFDDYDIYVWNGTAPIYDSLENGRYYLEFHDEGFTDRYSEIFTVVNDTEGYLKLVWYDQSDLIMDAGRIIYQGGYHNILYLQADLAKPEYLFTDEGEERDGYFFPTKQISEKRYHFSFLASEYLLDVLRFVRMSDFVTVTYRGKTYPCDTFLLTPEWQGEGDVASVSAEFDTATVAKKLDVGYIRGLRGDFNDDYNDDFDNRE